MLAWYLIYSKPQRERLARENLERQGYASYLPIVRARRRRQGRLVDVVEPMFARYLFVHLSDELDDWGPIRSTIGVSKLVRFGQVPARVPDGLIRSLRAREGADGVQGRAPPQLRSGEHVRIVDGVLSGYEAIFHASTSKERVVLLLQIAGRAAKVQVNAGQVVSAAPHWAVRG